MHVRMLGFLVAIISVIGATTALAEALPAGFQPSPFNGSLGPVTEGGVTTFHIDNEDCSSVAYDARGESDCTNGAVRNMMVLPFREVMGKSVEYKFDLLIDPSFSHEPIFNDQAVGYYPDGLDSRFRIANWEGPLLHNFIYVLKADRSKGIEFAGGQCQSPADFGKWVTFSMKIRWTDDDRGWIKVTCDDKLVYIDEEVATNQAPFCLIQSNCEPWLEKHPTRILLQIGAAMTGLKGVFTEIPKAGITVKVRNMSVEAGATLYSEEESAAVKALQTALNGLGCDVGTPDGVAGRKTHEAAVTCRDFGDGKLPRELTAANVQKFLAAYSDPSAAGLQPGKGPEPEPKFPKQVTDIKAAEIGALRFGEDPEIKSNFRVILASIDDQTKGLNVTLAGGVDARAESLFDLLVVLDDELGEAEQSKLDACGIVADTFSDGSKHPRILVKRIGNDFSFRNLDCLREVLPEKTAEDFAFVLGNFRDIAIAALESEVRGPIRHPAVKRFLQRVALGEIKVELGDAVSTEAPAILLAPTYIVKAREMVSNTGAGDVEVNSNIKGEVKGEGIKFEIQLKGMYMKKDETFFQLLVEFADDLGDKPMRVVKCGAGVGFDDEGAHLQIKFRKSPAGGFTLPKSDCFKEVLSKKLAAKVVFLLDHFSDLAVGMVSDGAVAEIGNDGLRSFMTRVASGEIPVGHPE